MTDIVAEEEVEGLTSEASMLRWRVAAAAGICVPMRSCDGLALLDGNQALRNREIGNSPVFLIWGATYGGVLVPCNVELPQSPPHVKQRLASFINC